MTRFFYSKDPVKSLLLVGIIFGAGLSAGLLMKGEDNMPTGIVALNGLDRQADHVERVTNVEGATDTDVSLVLVSDQGENEAQEGYAVIHSYSNEETIESGVPETPAVDQVYDVLPIGDPALETGSPVAAHPVLEQQFSTEQFDIEWAQQVETEVWYAFTASKLENSELTEVTCRSSICKIRASHDDEAAQLQFLRELASKAGNRSGHIARGLDSNGRLVTTVYHLR